MITNITLSILYIYIWFLVDITALLATLLVHERITYFIFVVVYYFLGSYYIRNLSKTKFCEYFFEDKQIIFLNNLTNTSGLWWNNLILKILCKKDCPSHVTNLAQHHSNINSNILVYYLYVNLKIYISDCLQKASVLSINSTARKMLIQSGALESWRLHSHLLGDTAVSPLIGLDKV